MLKVRSLTFGYQNQILFKNLDLNLEKGCLLHIKGKNGSGKSTLLKLLAGIIQHKTGDIEWSDTKQPFLYIAAEGNGLIPSLNLYENLEYFLSLYNMSLEQTQLQEAVSTWELGNINCLQYLPVCKFSTGMKRKLALCRLQLLSHIPTWILDEPLLGLDQKGSKRFIDLIQKKLRDGGAVILVTHDESVLKNLSQDILLKVLELPQI